MSETVWDHNLNNTVLKGQRKRLEQQLNCFIYEVNYKRRIWNIKTNISLGIG